MQENKYKKVKNDNFQSNFVSVLSSCANKLSQSVSQSVRRSLNTDHWIIQSAVKTAAIVTAVNTPYAMLIPSHGLG